jgi:hypothetical protein
MIVCDFCGEPITDSAQPHTIDALEVCQTVTTDMTFTTGTIKRRTLCALGETRPHGTAH